METPLDTLFLPFETGALALPGSVLFRGAAWHPMLPRMGRASCWQPWKFQAAMLEARGFKAAAIEPGGQDHEAALCFLPRQKEEAQYDLARAVQGLKDGGVLVAAAANDANGARIEKWFAELGLSPQSLSKNKARVAWAVKDRVTDAASAWLVAGAARQVDIDGDMMWSQPGLFGWDRADPGSRLLADHLPATLAGTGADLGCGFGYLARRAVESCAGIEGLYCVDADARAVECCLKNIAGIKTDVYGLWADATTPPDNLANLDFVVMNPPFHAGKKTDPDIGKTFIATAAACLKIGGTLYMVANARLPYEQALARHFGQVRKLAEAGGFKAYSAVR